MELGMAPELTLMSSWVQKKFQMTNLPMPNNSCSMKNAQKSVPGLADVGVPHGVGDGPPNSTQMYGGGLGKVTND